MEEVGLRAPTDSEAMVPYHKGRDFSLCDRERANIGRTDIWKRKYNA